MNPLGPRRDAPATGRNRDAILKVLRDTLPSSGRVLEVSCGTGQHAVYFARALPHLLWLPTDLDDGALESARAWIQHESLSNVEAPRRLDVTSTRWELPAVAGIFCANMIHIAPWEACLGLLSGAGRTLDPGAPLILYGPYKRGGVHTAPSNAAFDRSLRDRDPRWGVRDLQSVQDEAATAGFGLERTISMPANNLSLVFRRSGY